MNKSESPFDIFAKVGLTNYSLTVSPQWDKELEDSFFTIGLDGEDIGVIHRTDNDMWEWVEGGFGQIEADEIGAKIDSHYD